jgi:hypothetical protein
MIARTAPCSLVHSGEDSTQARTVSPNPQNHTSLRIYENTLAPRTRYNVNWKPGRASSSIG